VTVVKNGQKTHLYQNQTGAIAEVHRGSIKVESIIAEGSTFEIRVISYLRANCSVKFRANGQKIP
jgi:hypothetical protein